jgi:hypothetical protein
MSIGLETAGDVVATVLEPPCSIIGVGGAIPTNNDKPFSCERNVSQQQNENAAGA